MIGTKMSGTQDKNENIAKNGWIAILVKNVLQ